MNQERTRICNQGRRNPWPVDRAKPEKAIADHYTRADGKRKQGKNALSKQGMEVYYATLTPALVCHRAKTGPVLFVLAGQSEQGRMYGTVLKKGMIMAAMLAIALSAAAADRSADPPPSYLTRLACRIAVRNPGSLSIKPLIDRNIDTMSEQQADRSVSATLSNGQILTAIVQHVYVTLPRDRFNITLLLDGKPHTRINHIDLDIFTETTIADQSYLLHCFRDFERDPDIQ
jgi:hypothetical protein